MRVPGLVAFGALAVLWSPGAAGPPGSLYTVEELQRIARSAHPTLAAAEAGLEQAEGALRQARAYPNPDLAAAGGRGRPRDGGDARSEASFTLLQPIEMPGVRRWRARVAELRLEGAEIERAAAAWVVDAAVVRLASTVLAARRRVEIARESAGIAARLHELLARRAELGESSPLEAVRTRSERFARQRDLLDASAALDAARSALEIFCGRRLGSGYEVIEPPAPPAGPPDLPGDLAARLREGNPLLRQAALVVRQADAGIELEKRATLPRVDLFAESETELDRAATSVGIGLTIPLWDWNRGAIAAATAQRRRVDRELQALLVDLETELSRAEADYRRARAAIELHAEGWTAAAAESLRIATFSFENGEAPLLEVLDAQRSHLEVRLAEAEAWTAWRLARAEIERLIGGPLGEEGNHEGR